MQSFLRHEYSFLDQFCKKLNQCFVFSLVSLVRKKGGGNAERCLQVQNTLQVRQSCSLSIFSCQSEPQVQNTIQAREVRQVIQSLDKGCSHGLFGHTPTFLPWNCFLLCFRP